MHDVSVYAAARPGETGRAVIANCGTFPVRVVRDQADGILEAVLEAIVAKAREEHANAALTNQDYVDLEWCDGQLVAEAKAVTFYLLAPITPEEESEVERLREVAEAKARIAREREAARMEAWREEFENTHGFPPPSMPRFG